MNLRAGNVFTLLCDSVHKGGAYVVVGGGIHGTGCAWQWVCMAGGGCVVGGHVWQGDMCGRGACMQEMATEVSGMHPTGMHSCYQEFNKN